jgi:ATP-dependent DNA helicase RecG
MSGISTHETTHDTIHDLALTQKQALYWTSEMQKEKAEEGAAKNAVPHTNHVSHRGQGH